MILDGPGSLSEPASRRCWGGKETAWVVRGALGAKVSLGIRATGYVEVGLSSRFQLRRLGGVFGRRRVGRDVAVTLVFARARGEMLVVFVLELAKKEGESSSMARWDGEGQ
jgi:hypothetical protein